MEAQEFGRYRLERLIGSGGMGDVYQALDLERDRVVALKLLPPLFSGNEEFLQRFRRESRVAARLREPHIIPIHDYGEIERRLFIDMRLVDDGRTIANLLRDEGPLESTRAVNLIGQVAEALDAAHADGLIHRDIKPSNVLVTDRDFVYVMDFGIAHAIGHTATGLTLSGATIGTLDYMAPERFGNRALDPRSDVYSLACLLYQCLTARTPFPGQDLPALMYAHLHEDPPAASAAETGVPPTLDTVIAIGMAKRPDDRYTSAGGLAEAAYSALASSGTLSSSRPPGGRLAANERTAGAAAPNSGSPAETASLSAGGSAGAAAAHAGPVMNGSSDGSTLLRRGSRRQRGPRRPHRACSAAPAAGCGRPGPARGTTDNAHQRPRRRGTDRGCARRGLIGSGQPRALELGTAVPTSGSPRRDGGDRRGTPGRSDYVLHRVPHSDRRHGAPRP